jgi:hypothetical protein
MNQKSTLIKLFFVIVLSTFSLVAAAQTPAPFTGPTDANTAPPTTASAVAQVLCNASAITLKGDADPTGTMKYNWYKTNSSGVKTLVKTGVNKDNAYTETSTDAGYYTYQLVMVNGNGCETPSDPFNLYVLPPLNATVDGQSSVCANNQTTTDLTISGLDSRFTYTYQWYRETTLLTGETTNKHTVTELTAGATPVKYSVLISYVLKPTCNQQPAKNITVTALPTKPTITFGN